MCLFKLFKRKINPNITPSHTPGEHQSWTTEGESKYVDLLGGKSTGYVMGETELKGFIFRDKDGNKSFVQNKNIDKNEKI